MADKMDTEQYLDRLFKAAKTAPPPSEALMARILADAGAETRMRHAPQAHPRRRGLLAGVLGAIGGWPAVAGLATATVVGVWIGLNPPVALEAVAQALIGNSAVDSYLADVMPGADDFLAKG